MGGDPKLRQLLKEQRHPECFSDEQPMMHNHVVIDDMLTFMHYLRGPGPNGTFTTRELFNHYYARVLNALKNEYASTFIIVCDYAANVPAKKRRVQKERIKHSKFEPLDDSWTLTADGIQQGNKEAVRFVADCVIATRRMRLQLCRIFCAFLRALAMPAGKQIIFDFEAGGPHRFTSKGCTQLADCDHEIGEADIAFPFYLKACAGRSVVINTIDTDIIPILLIYLYKTPANKRPKQLCWTYVNQSRTVSNTTSSSSTHDSFAASRLTGRKLKNQNYRKPDNIFVDFLRLFTEMTVNDTDYADLRAYCLTHIFAGNDYVEKSQYCTWFNLKDIESAISRCGYTSSDNELLILEQTSLDWIVNYLQHLYFVKFNTQSNNAWNFNVEQDPLTQKTIYSVPSCDKFASTQKQHRWPDHQQFTEQSSNIKWLIKYWFQDAMQHEPVNLFVN